MVPDRSAATVSWTIGPHGASWRPGVNFRTEFDRWVMTLTPYHNSMTTRARFPTATAFTGGLFVTTAAARTAVLSPMVTPGQVMTSPPSHTFSPSVRASPPLFSGAVRDRSGARASGFGRWDRSGSHCRLQWARSRARESEAMLALNISICAAARCISAANSGSSTMYSSTANMRSFYEANGNPTYSWRKRMGKLGK